MLKKSAKEISGTRVDSQIFIAVVSNPYLLRQTEFVLELGDAMRERHGNGFVRSGQ